MKLLHPDRFGGCPACVLMDLDNTLYAYAPCHEAGMAAAQGLAWNMLKLSPDDFRRCFDDARVELKARLGAHAASHHRLLYFQRMLERAGLASRPVEALQLQQAYWRTYLDAMRLFPGVVDFVDDLRLADIPLVIVTDLTSEIQLRKLIALELDSKIDFIVTSEEAGADKPSPVAYELALAKLGGVEGPIWMIGDNHLCDLEGAKDAIGAITLQIRHDGVTSSPAGCSKTDGWFGDFRELSRFLARSTIG